MKNERQMKPLREYTVYPTNLTSREVEPDVFTADGYTVVDGRTLFFNAGNLVREYQTRVQKIIATPVDANEIPE